MTFSSRTAVAAIFLWAAACQAWGQTTEPQGFQPSSVTGWLLLETDIRPEQVVAVGANSVAAIVEDRGVRDGAHNVLVRTETLERQDVGDALSSSVEVSVDCEKHRTRQGAITAHTQHNLAGSGRVVAPQEDNWTTPAPQTQLENVWRAVCDPTFHPPLAPRSPAASPATSGAAAAKPPSPPPAANPAPKPNVRTAQPHKEPTRSGLVVQAGAYATQAEAREARAKLTKFGGPLEGREIQIQPVQVREKKFYRVLVLGFSDASQAEAACAKLKAAGDRCFIKAPEKKSPR
jgi:cell division protein FtsN